MISIIIPTYNNGDIITRTVTEIAEKMISYNKEFEIIVVSDGGTDDTYSKIVYLQNKYKELRFFSYETNTGKGAAVTVGFSKAQGEYIGFLDSDNSVSLDSWIEMVDIITSPNNVYGCVIASRYKDYKNVVQPFIRKISGYSFNFIVNSMFNLKLKDTQCGGKIFTRESVDLILRNTSIKGFSFDVDYLLTLVNNNVSIKEHSVSWVHKGDFSFWGNLKAILYLGGPMVSDLEKLKNNSVTAYTFKDILYNGGESYD